MHAKVFDIDGTLLQSNEVDDALYREAVRAVLGSVQFRESISDYDHVTDSGIIQQLLDDNQIASEPTYIPMIRRRFVSALSDHVEKEGPFQEIPGAMKYFHAYRESTDHCVAIATGGWRESAMLKLDSAGFDVTDVPLATSDDSACRSEIMQIAVNALGSEFESITYYGDALWDKKACDELGWNFVAVGPALGGLDSYLLTQD